MIQTNRKRIITLIGKEMNTIMNLTNQRMGVYILVSHLIITLAVICLYGVSMFSGKDTSVLEGLLFVVFGYWFGSITKDSLKSAEKISDNVDKNSVINPQTIVVREESKNENI